MYDVWMTVAAGWLPPPLQLPFQLPYSRLSSGSDDDSTSPLIAAYATLPIEAVPASPHLPRCNNQLIALSIADRGVDLVDLTVAELAEEHPQDTPQAAVIESTASFCHRAVCVYLHWVNLSGFSRRTSRVPRQEVSVTAPCAPGAADIESPPSLLYLPYPYNQFVASDSPPSALRRLAKVGAVLTFISQKAKI